MDKMPRLGVHLDISKKSPIPAGDAILQLQRPGEPEKQ